MNTVESTLSIEQKLYGLMIIWAEAKYAFPSFDKLPDLDWDQSLQDFIPRVISAEDVRNYYQLLMEFSALLKDGHTMVVPPWGRTNPENDIPPLEVQVIGDKFVVARAGEADEISTQRIYQGLEIIEVEGIPVRDYFEDNVLRYHSGGSKQADEAMYILYILDGPKNTNISLKVKDMDGKLRSVILPRNSTDNQGNPFQYRFLQWNPVMDADLLSSGVLYIKIAHFMNPALANEFLELIDNLDQSDIKGIVIDLRYSLGGRSDLAESMLSGLIDQPVDSPIYKYHHYIPAYRSWGREPQWSEINNTITPRDGNRYLGPLVLLTGGVTSSTAEDFAISLHCSGRAVLIGEKTAGSTGNPIQIPLPGGGSFEVSTFTASYPDGREYAGIGIQPDIEIYPTQEDIYIGIDPILEKGIDVIAKWDE